MATSSFYKSSGSTPTAENSINTSVSDASTSAANAATSATNAAGSATSAQNSLNSFQQYYLGAHSSAPTTSQDGALYFNTGSNQLFIWDGNSWEATAAATDTDSVSEGSTNLYFTNARATSAVTGSDLDMSGNKVLFGNMYATEADLPSATTYHGMFAHVHATGKGYFAHGGSWHKLLDETSSDTDDLTEGSTNLYYTDARVSAHLNATSALTGQYLQWNGSDFAWASQSSNSGSVSNFLDLGDTPNSYTSQAGKLLKVNSSGLGVEFATDNTVELSDLSVTTATASGGGGLAYNNSTGVFTFTPAVPSSGGSSTFCWTVRYTRHNEFITSRSVSAGELCR